MRDPRRLLPSVDAVLASAPMAEPVRRYGRAEVRRCVREVLDEVRAGLADGGPAVGEADLAVRVQARLAERARPSLQRVVNATGVVLHTNLGRAPLAAEALAAMAEVAAGYSNLEYDLDGGRRGSRYVHCSGLLSELTGAEDALVVNNCAGALLLALNTLAAGHGVAVSRGELVEIGGGFRVPEILARSGARLVEVGSTNRTRSADYAAVAGEVAAILKVHRSNFRITGFTEDAALAELSELAADRALPLIYDLGSGLLLDPERLGLPPEPTPQRALQDGADLVAFSGDKLLGGPQAGVLVGRRDLVAELRRNPLCRALRVDKATLAGLEATLRLYRDPELALARIPVLRMLAAPPERLEERAHALAARLRDAGCDADAVRTEGAVGGGTFPGVTLASAAVRLTPPSPRELAGALRAASPPVVGRIEDDALLLDLRTVDADGGDDLLVASVCAAWGRGRGAGE